MSVNLSDVFCHLDQGHLTYELNVLTAFYNVLLGGRGGGTLSVPSVFFQVFHSIKNSLSLVYLYLPNC